ncbi:hypothetical protein EDC01DRAFT_776576 [Geopyxis carbonaria]|nr:hypothetical protein EDC01DRAFT_776576 [Geopyxis carbonaria]
MSYYQNITEIKPVLMPFEGDLKVSAQRQWLEYQILDGLYMVSEETALATALFEINQVVANVILKLRKQGHMNSDAQAFVSPYRPGRHMAGHATVNQGFEVAQCTSAVAVPPEALPAVSHDDACPQAAPNKPEPATSCVETHKRKRVLQTSVCKVEKATPPKTPSGSCRKISPPSRRSPTPPTSPSTTSTVTSRDSSCCSASVSSRSSRDSSSTDSDDEEDEDSPRPEKRRRRVRNDPGVIPLIMRPKAVLPHNRDGLNPRFQFPVMPSRTRSGRLR